MSRETRALKDLQKALLELERVPEPFAQRERAERAEKARLLCHESHRFSGRLAGSSEARQVWIAAAALFHKAVDQAYPFGFWENFELLRVGNSSALPMAVEFLEADPWFFRSGYVKADLIRFITQIELKQVYVSRLQQVVVDAICSRDRREFRSYCRLARKVVSLSLRQELEALQTSSSESVRRRAKWVIEALSRPVQK